MRKPSAVTMAPRKTRIRRTADKMAVYKAAASKNRRDSVPAPKSRTSPKSSGRGSTRTSPRTSARSSPNKNLVDTGKSTRQSAECRPVHSTEKERNDGNNNQVASQLETRDRSRSMNYCAGNDQIVFDMDEVIPETPPRQSPRVFRKRIVAPRLSDICSAFSDEEVEGGKPTKKRKVFNTPPRSEDRAVNSSVISMDGMPRSSNPASKIRGRAYSDFPDSPIQEDALMEPPLPSVQKIIPAPRRAIAESSSRARELGSRHAALFHERASSIPRSPHESVERSAPGPVSLEMVTTSSATLSRMFEGFSRRLKLEIEDMRDAQMGEIRRIGESLNDTMASEIRDIQGLFEMMTGFGKNLSRGFTNANTSLRDWEKKLDGLTPYSTVIFGKDLFSRILSFNAPLKAVDTYSKYGGCEITDVERCSFSAQTLLFRLQPADKKFQYLDDIGKLHTDFKFSVIRNAFYNVHLDSFGLFKATRSARNDDDDEKKMEGHIDVHRKIERPPWLAKRYVSVDHIIGARSFTENPGQSRKEKARRTPTPDDIACHGALHVYRQLGKVLHDGRSNFRVAFFQGLGFLLVPWKGRVADVDQSSLRLEFSSVDGLGDPSPNLDLAGIPHASQCPHSSDANTVTSVDAANKKLLREIFSQWREMILTADHEVVLSRSGQQKTAQSRGEKKVIHRLINLIDVALDCCVEYCRAGSREKFLRSSKNSFRYVMVFAVLFKAICIEFITTRRKSCDSAVHALPEPTDVKLHGTCLKDLIPGLSTQKSVLGNKCLHMSYILYETLNHVSEKDRELVCDEGDAGNPEVLDFRKIEESLEEGVCQI